MANGTRIRKWTGEGWKDVSDDPVASGPRFSSKAAEEAYNALGADAREEVDATGSGGKITVQDVENAAKVEAQPTAPE